MLTVFSLSLFMFLSFNMQIMVYGQVTETPIVKTPVELVAEPLSYKEAIYLDEEFTVTINVSNIGNQTALGIRVELRIYRGLIPIYSQAKYIDVPPSTTQKITFGPWKPQSPGIYRFEVIVDSLNKYKEHWEWNNKVSGEFNVKLRPTPTPSLAGPPKLSLFDVDKIKMFSVAYGVKGHINDEKSINIIKENFQIYSLRQDTYITYGPGDNLLIIGGPIVNSLAKKYNALIGLNFEKGDRGIELKINQQGFLFNWEMFSREDYAVLAVLKHGGVNIWLAEGCTRHGTLAAIWLLINGREYLFQKSLVVIHWIDLDNSRSPSPPDEYKIVYSS